MNSKTIEISWASLWRVLFFAMIVLVLFLGRMVLIGVFLAIIISSGLDVVVNFMEKRGIPRTLSVIFIFLAALILLVFIFYSAIPKVIVDLRAVFASLDNSAFGGFAPLFDIKSSESIESFIRNFSSEFFSQNISPLGMLSRAFGGVGLAIATLVIAFYLSVSRDGIERFLRVVLPVDYEKEGLRIYERSRRRIGYWFQSQILLSAVMGFLVWGALFLLGVKHSLLLGLLAGIFELVPFVGPILSGAAAILVAFSSGANLALYALLVFLGLHQFESHVLVPLIMRKMVGMHPVIVIVSMLIGVETLGFLGVLIAVPAAAVFEEVIEEWSSKKRAPVPVV